MQGKLEATDSAAVASSLPAAEAPTVLEAPSLASAKTTMMEGPAPVSGKLIVQSGPLANQEFPLGDSLRLGRETDNDLVIPDGKVSRHHARIERQGTQYQITDLGSSNGTLVNGERIAAPTALADGDMLLIGEISIMFAQSATR